MGMVMMNMVMNGYRWIWMDKDMDRQIFMDEWMDGYRQMDIDRWIDIGIDEYFMMGMDRYAVSGLPDGAELGGIFGQHGEMGYGGGQKLGRRLEADSA